MKVGRHNSDGCTAKAGRLLASALLLTVVSWASVTSAQVQATPGYEVATIKPSPEGPPSMIGVIPKPDGIHAENANLRLLVRVAFGAKRFPTDDRVSGGPEWAKSQRFDIDAKMSDADVAAMQKLTQDEQNEMRNRLTQALLADRFKLKTHFETKQAPVYELVVAKGGSKLKEAKPDDEIKAPTGKGIKGSVMFYGKGQVRAQNYTTKNIADFLSGPMAGVGRPVIDKTGLTGSYSFELHTALDRSEAGNGAPDEGSSIFTALQDDLGLKLQPATGSVDTIVIDHAEQPTEN